MLCGNHYSYLGDEKTESHMSEELKVTDTFDTKALLYGSNCEIG